MKIFKNKKNDDKKFENVSGGNFSFDEIIKFYDIHGNLNSNDNETNIENQSENDTTKK